MQVATTFANGINPFPQTPIMKTTNKGGRPAKANTLPKEEDYSTPYKPPALAEQSQTATVNVATKPTKSRYIDPATLVICDDPLPAHRAAIDGKYDEILAKLKMGQAIKCQPVDVGRIQGAVRKFITQRKLAAEVKSCKDYGDGMGRVWMLAAKRALKVAA